MTFPLPSLEWGTTLGLASDGELDRDEIKSHLREKFGAHAVPKEFLASVGLPYTSIGKPDRPRLRAIFERQVQ